LILALGTIYVSANPIRFSHDLVRIWRPTFKRSTLPAPQFVAGNHGVSVHIRHTGGIRRSHVECEHHTDQQASQAYAEGERTGASRFRLKSAQIQSKLAQVLLA
jgi:hypothetical protein